MKTFLGLIITCVLVPAVYAGLAYWYVAEYGQNSAKERPLATAILIAFPLVVSGVPKWWDVWVKPSPKLGSPGKQYPPSQFINKTVKLNAIGIVACVVIHLLFNQFIATDVAATQLTLDVPKAKARLAQVEGELADARMRRETALLKRGERHGPTGLLADMEHQEVGLDVDRLTQERNSLSAQLADHEQKANKLEAVSKNPGDFYSGLALMALFGSAFYFSLYSPINKNFHSGQPIAHE